MKKFFLTVITLVTATQIAKLLFYQLYTKKRQQELLKAYPGLSALALVPRKRCHMYHKRRA